MKTRITLLLLLSLSFIHANAQSIPNGGFENWTTKTLYSEPIGYFTSNPWVYGSAGVGNIEKSTEARFGEFAAKLQTIKVKNDTMPGMLVIGTPGTGGINGGLPFIGMPDTISFYAKYDINPLDIGYFIVAFKKNGVYLSQAIATFTGTEDTYKRFKVLTNLTSQPDSMVAFITPSRMDPPKYPGSTLWIDSISFIHSTEPFPNGNLEDWTTLKTEEPDNWNSTNKSSDLNHPTAIKSTETHSGSFALQLQSVSTSWGGTIAYITNGYMGKHNEGPIGGMQVSANPKKVSGYYKYTPNGDDNPIVGLFSYHYDAVAGKSTNIETQIIKLPATDTYTYFEVPMNYNGTDQVDSLNIFFAANDMMANKTNVGSVLFLDDLDISYYDLPTNIIMNNENETRVYLVGKVLHIDRIESQVSELILLNSIGQKVVNTNLNGSNTSLQVGSLPNGIYIYNLKNNDGSTAKSGKVIKN
jgi:hypothetical protein